MGVRGADQAPRASSPPAPPVSPREAGAARGERRGHGRGAARPGRHLGAPAVRGQPGSRTLKAARASPLRPWLWLFAPAGLDRYALAVPNGHRRPPAELQGPRVVAPAPLARGELEL